ncbi:MAG: inositol monophosphatase [Pseudohongiella sp.]|nr:inositol monophosphatase [Pseudohongiella sp.]MDP2127932.1 inositol monophosphatase [Pseudohongiella sp.]
MHPVINIALRAARSAAEQIVHVSDRLDRVSVIEDTNGNLITSMDVDVERTLLYHLLKAYPDYSIDSRLSGFTEGADKDNVWLIDPLVSNRNFFKGYGSFCVTLALKTPKGISHGVVVNPVANQEFTASRGDGAQLNDSRVRIGKMTTLENAYVALDPEQSLEDTFLPQLQEQLLAVPVHLRMSGCAALDMVYVAAGRLDAGWCRQQHHTSIAAAQLILLESGALISDPTGNPQTQGGKELLFGNPKCFKHLLQIRQTLKAQA